MEAANSMTAEELQSKIAQLQTALEEQEQNTIQAAMFGKSLLEENSDLKNRIDDLMKQHATALEEMHQETCSLQSRVEVAAHTEKWQQEEIASLRTELQNLSTNIRQQAEEEKRHETAALKKQMDSLQLDLEHVQSLEQEQRGRVAELEALLQTHLDRTAHHSFSTSFTSVEMAALSEEVSNLQMDLTELKAKNIEIGGQLQQCQLEKDILTNKLKSASVEIEDLQCQAVSYSRHLEEARREVLELRAQLDASQLDSQKHNSKGNSIFSELEDRRVVLEKMMASLKVQNQQLKEKYNIEKQQNNKYKMQIAMALQMSNKMEDPAIQRLRDQLSKAHAEIRTLTDRLEELESSQGGLSSQLTAGDLLDKVEDKNYAQYLMAIIKTEKENAAKARSELQTKSLQHLDMTNQNMELARQNKLLEVQRDKLQSQLIKASIEKEELLVKYAPDKVKEGKLERRVVEKIDMGEAQFQMQDKIHGASGRPSDIFKPCPATGRASSIFKPVTTTGRASDVFKPMAASGRLSNVFKPMNVLDRKKPLPDEGQKPEQNLKSKLASQKVPSIGEEDDSVFFSDKENADFLSHCSESPPNLFQDRKVSLADDVKVIYPDGEESMTTLTNDANKSGPSEAMKKKKQPKPARKVQHVKAAEAQQYECKTQ